MSELGALLRKLRGKESLRDASKRTGISHTYLSILEKGVDLRSGTPVQPSADTLKRLSKAYNYPYEELLKVAGILDDDDTKTETSPNIAFFNGGENLTEEEIEYLKESLEVYRKMKARREKK